MVENKLESRVSAEEKGYIGVSHLEGTRLLIDMQCICIGCTCTRVSNNRYFPKKNYKCKHLCLLTLAKIYIHCV